MYRLARLFLLWMAFHLKTAIALGPTNQHIRPIDISLEAWYLNSSGNQFRSSLLILSQHAYFQVENSLPSITHPPFLVCKCLSHIPRACLMQSGVEFCMRWETGPLCWTILWSSFQLHPLLTSDGPVISYFCPILWWMRCQAQDVFWSLHPGLLKLMLQSDVCRNDSVSHPYFPAMIFNCLHWAFSKLRK